jgi:hypothetical protein
MGGSILYWTAMCADLAHPKTSWSDSCTSSSSPRQEISDRVEVSCRQLVMSSRVAAVATILLSVCWAADVQVAAPALYGDIPRPSGGEAGAPSRSGLGAPRRTGQNGGWSLKSPPRSACRSRPWLRSP